MVPVRGWLDGIRRFMGGALYFIGRGSTQRGLKRSRFCNDFKVSVYGRDEAIWRFEQKLKSDPELRESLWTLSGLRLVCHCTGSRSATVMQSSTSFAAFIQAPTTETFPPQPPHRHEY